MTSFPVIPNLPSGLTIERVSPVKPGDMSKCIECNLPGKFIITPNFVYAVVNAKFTLLIILFPLDKFYEMMFILYIHFYRFFSRMRKLQKWFPH